MEILDKQESGYANAIAEEHFDFAKIISRKYCRQIGFDCNEDIESEGLVGLVKAINSHLPLRLSFKSWAAFKIRTEISTYIKDQFRTKKGMAKKQAIMVSVEEVDLVRNVLEKQTCVKDQVSKLLKFIPEHWRKVLILHYIRGYSLKEIGDSKGYSKANASRIKMAALRKIKKRNRLWDQG